MRAYQSSRAAGAMRTEYWLDWEAIAGYSNGWNEMQEARVEVCQELRSIEGAEHKARGCGLYVCGVGYMDASSHFASH